MIFSHGLNTDETRIQHERTWIAWNQAGLFGPFSLTPTSPAGRGSHAVRVTTDRGGRFDETAEERIPSPSEGEGQGEGEAVRSRAGKEFTTAFACFSPPCLIRVQSVAKTNL